MRASLRKRLLQRALELSGGRTLLSARLGVADSRLDGWLQGYTPVPTDVFEAAVEIVLEDEIARATQDRRAEPRSGESILL
jgi:hypothetical protein